MQYCVTIMSFDCHFASKNTCSFASDSPYVNHRRVEKLDRRALSNDQVKTTAYHGLPNFPDN